MALVGLQYKPLSLDVNEVCYNKEQDILTILEKRLRTFFDPIFPPY